ncbi:YihY/virulence factor BrkB family protein [Phenylobacterium immobile]|uniref:YihY/virulence factor BrkB family protein n=1 Tax=Phenylobacterium immobile TaxID=21 RepID=UPI001FE1D5C3|nr:YihY/virulence factor BrkB family protein [Phenylobacterium immobile]
MRRADPLRWDMAHWLRVGLNTVGRALTRLWGRDVMLYTGGASFFVMLAIFPALALMIGGYSLFSDPEHAAETARGLAQMAPAEARPLLQGEFLRLAHAPHVAMSAQSVLAFLIGAYAAHRGLKAVIAGLSFIHDEDEPRGFVSFNLMVLAVLIAVFVLIAVITTVFFSLRVMGSTFALRPLRGVSWLLSEWTWASIGLTLCMGLIYRFVMSRRPVDWRASFAGGAAAAGLCLFASWGIAVYVEQIAHLGATYGSVAAIIVFLIWLSWNVNALFFGGALATEIELSIDAARPFSP